MTARDEPTRGRGEDPARAAAERRGRAARVSDYTAFFWLGKLVEYDRTDRIFTAPHEKLTEDVDAILDEIDDVLETNAEDFVKSFIQKGGQ